MPFRTRRFAANACLLLGLGLAAAGADATPTAARFHKPPPAGDNFLAWTTRAMASMHAYNLGDFSPLRTDTEWVNEYLADPASIYSDLHPRLFAGERAEAAEHTAFPTSTKTARIIAWDLGLDKALPGFQSMADTPRVTGKFGTAVITNLEKADVAPAYFQKAYDLGATHLISINAEFAVALQVLHEWVEATPWADREDLGIYDDVLQRVMAATSLNDLRDQDLTYLADIVRGELSAWRAGRLNSHGQREIRTALRIARVAAAYRTTRAGYAACNADGSKNDAAGENPEDITKPICFSDATDRAVYRWYRATRRHQLAQAPEAFGEAFDSAVRLIDAFGDVRPAWAGAYTNQALDWSNHAEVLDAQMALETQAPGDVDTAFYRLVERANLLICRKSAP